MRRTKLCTAAALTAIGIAAFCMTSYATMDLESGAPVSGISVALNNYYARTMEPEKGLVDTVRMANSALVINDEVTQPKKAVEKLVEETQEVAAIPESAYKNIAISKIDVPVNIRAEATTQSESVGKIANHAAATILETVEGEDGTWYKIQSGSVIGYIKSNYFVTGEEAEQLAKQVSKVYGKVVGTQTLKLRKEPNLESTTLTLLAEGEIYQVIGEEGNFLKIQVDDDLVGYVYKEYMDTNVTYDKAISEEEEKQKKAEEEKRKKEAEEALRKLEEEKKKAAETIAETTAETVEQTTAETTSNIVEAPPGEDEDDEGDLIESLEDDLEEDYEDDETEEEEVTKATTQAQTPQGPGGFSPGSSTERNAIVAYARQFLGGAYVYGGTSLTDGVDCSGFTMRIYEKFGYNIGRTSRDQAAKGKEISASDARPGDLFFYASDGYINHVAMYIGDGQVIHASSSTTGIITSSAYYRTPCKVCTFLK